MAKRGKTYGYVQALWELGDTVPSLFRKISEYKKANQIRTTALWTAMTKLSLLPWPFRLLLRSFRHRDTNGNLWNLCHFFNNFEIADMDFYRSKAYRTLFEYLDNDGGFYYERVCKPASLYKFKTRTDFSTVGRRASAFARRRPSPEPWTNPPLF